MEVTNASTGQPIKVISQDEAGFNGMKAEDFLKILVEQLKYQDPTQPMTNEELLNQIGQIRSLQSNLELSSALSSLTLSQGLNSGASFLGKQVTGTNANGDEIGGVVDRVIMRDNKVVLGVGEEELTIDKIETVQQAAA